MFVQCIRFTQMKESALHKISFISALCIFFAVAILPLCGCAVLPRPPLFDTRDVTNAHLIAC